MSITPRRKRKRAILVVKRKRRAKPMRPDPMTATVSRRANAILEEGSRRLHLRYRARYDAPFVVMSSRVAPRAPMAAMTMDNPAVKAMRNNPIANAARMRRQMAGFTVILP